MIAITPHPSVFELGAPTGVGAATQKAHFLVPLKPQFLGAHPVHQHHAQGNTAEKPGSLKAPGVRVVSDRTKKKASRRQRNQRKRNHTARKLVNSDVPEYDSTRFQGLTDRQLIGELRRYARRHKKIGYRVACMVLMNFIEREDTAVECFYTGRLLDEPGLPKASNMNVEHLWPRSRGLKSAASKRDLHHLVASDASFNSVRGNHPFGIVVDTVLEMGGSKVGRDEHGTMVCEPRDEVKGNVARALFYMSAIYGMEIPDDEEALLREWHEADPVDTEELEENDASAAAQGNHNPFVKQPELVAAITDF